MLLCFVEFFSTKVFLPWNCFVVSWRLPGSFLGLPGDLVSIIINKEVYRKPQGSYTNFQGRNPYNIFVVFLVETITPKRHFEINWPLKVSKYRKQNTKFSHPPKNQRNFVHFFAQSSKSGWIKKKKNSIILQSPLLLIQIIEAFYFFFQPLFLS